MLSSPAAQRPTQTGRLHGTPKRYDHAFDGKETIAACHNPVPEACKKLFKDAGLDIEVGPNQKGCGVYRGKNGIIIVIDRPFMGATPEAVIRHERGHLNGWPSDHRTEVPATVIVPSRPARPIRVDGAGAFPQAATTGRPRQVG